MAANEIFKDSDNIALPVPDGILAGKPVRIGILNAVTQVDEGTGGNAAGYGSTKLTGAWLVPVAGALTIGQAVYIKKSDNTLTATATGNVLFGAALREKGTGTAETVVRIINSGNDVAGV